MRVVQLRARMHRPPEAVTHIGLEDLDIGVI